MFTLTRSVSTSRLIDVPLHLALEALHDPPTIIQLNPLVIHYEASSSDQDFYTITDKLVVFGLWTTETKYNAKFATVDEGVDVIVTAGVGTKVTSRWRARTVEDRTELYEEATVEASFLLMPFIIRTLRTSHAETFERLAAKLKNNPSPQLHEQRPGPTLIPSTLAILPSILTAIWYPDFHYIYQLAIASVALSVVLWFLTKTQDPYGLFHLSLNKLPGENPNANPRTEWLNMGYWKETDVFPEACEALALKLVTMAGCKEGCNILDVGHGTGDSLLLHLASPLAPRPTRLTGITSLRIHYKRSSDRITRLQSSRRDLKATEVDLHHTDAVYRPTAINHPLDPSSRSPPFHYILALDCAYHFNTRHDFLCQSFKRLAPGGRIALADIVFTSAALSTPSLKARALTSVFHLMPKANMITAEQYIQNLKSIGYVDIALEDVSDHVFPGFQRFLRPRGLGWAIFATVIGWYYSVGIRFVIVGGSKREDVKKSV